jgi:hypothetical protein
VLLLALALEARLFTVRPRKLDDRRANQMQWAAIWLSLAMVVVLIFAEIQAIFLLGEAEKLKAPLQYGALTWGFTTVALIAILGVRRARVTMTLQWYQQPGSVNSVVVECGASNEFGDQDITLLLNLLVPNGLSIHRCDAYGNREPGGLKTLPLRDEKIDGISKWNYPSEYVLVSAGNATLRYFLVNGMNLNEEYPLVLRYDHVELDNGRIEKHTHVRATAEGDASDQRHQSAGS